MSDTPSTTANERAGGMVDAHRDERAAANSPPRSVTYLWINTLALLMSIAAWVWVRNVPAIPHHYAALICIAAYAAVVIVFEVAVYKVHRRSTTGLDYDKDYTPSIARVVLKSLGLYLTLGVLGGCFWLFDIYARDFFEPLRSLRDDWRSYLPVLVVLQWLYFLFVDGYQRQPEDMYWRLGCALVRRAVTIDVEALKQFALGWLVKGFFLPIMFVYLVNNFGVLNFAWWETGGFFGFYEFMFTTLFTIDLLITCCGYMLTVRVFDSHIRTTEPTTLGWLVAVMCYYPFWQTIYDAYFRYEDGVFWGHMVDGAERQIAIPVPWGDGVVDVVPWVLVWGLANIAVLSVYVWATLAFGIRFSNLTHRGVLTNGPYRWCKHPAYVSKNLSWWLISVPFYFHDNATFADTVRHCLMLAGVNVIYVLRARTEERHLSWDPDYVAYATWMNEHSLFSGLGKIMPFFRYEPPRHVLVKPSE